MTDQPEKKKPHYNDIPLESGVNDCHWVFERRCTNPLVTRNIIPQGFSRDWESKQNCVVTIAGTIHCSGFKFMAERQISGIYKFIRIKRKGREELRQVIKMILCDEFTGIGEELVDNIEEDILDALGMEREGGAEWATGQRRKHKNQ